MLDVTDVIEFSYSSVACRHECSCTLYVIVSVFSAFSLNPIKIQISSCMLNRVLHQNNDISETIFCFSDCWITPESLQDMMNSSAGCTY